MNIKRGIQKTFLFAAVGFTIPAGVIGLIAIYHFSFQEIHPIDRANDFARLPKMILLPSLGLGMLFGLSAFASYVPERGLTLIRSLIVIADAALIAVIATRPKVRYKSDDPNAWMETVIPISVSIVAAIVVASCARQIRSAEANGKMLKQT
jgi:Kef-type K+ transport system membrane component KefB